jgi:hypothetical protein
VGQALARPAAKSQAETMDQCLEAHRATSVAAGNPVIEALGKDLRQADAHLSAMRRQIARPALATAMQPRRYRATGGTAALITRNARNDDDFVAADTD